MTWSEIKKAVEQAGIGEDEPGMVFKVGPKVTGYAGYSIANQNPSNGIISSSSRWDTTSTDKERRC